MKLSSARRGKVVSSDGQLSDGGAMLDGESRGTEIERGTERKTNRETD